ncbi:MAG: CBS domain-containing protein [Gammaproteobacteria bacterium]
MQTVRQLLQAKGTDVWAVGPDTSVYDAIKIMTDKDIGALIVREGGNTVGLMSERDYVRNVILQGRSSKETEVREIMTPRVVCARPDQTIEECMAVMTEKRVRHLPVMDGSQLLGIISIGDLVKAMIEEQQFIIEQLVHYITDSRNP